MFSIGKQLALLALASLFASSLSAAPEHLPFFKKDHEEPAPAERENSAPVDRYPVPEQVTEASEASDERLLAARELPTVWTRALAIEWALDRNVRILNAHTALEREIGRKWSTRAALLPSLSASAAYNAREESLIDRSERELGVPPSQRTGVATQSWNGRLEIRQVLFDGFSSVHRLRSTEAEVEAALWAERDMVVRVVSEVEQVFDQLLSSYRAITVRREAAALRERLLEMARSRLQAGAEIEYEVLRAESELARAESAVAEALTNWKQAWEQFVILLQLPAEAAGADADTVSFEGEFEPIAFDMAKDEVLLRSLEKNRRLRAAQSRIEAREQEVKATQQRAWPRLEGYFGYERTTSYFDFERELEGFVGGFTASWDIFDGFRRRGQLKSSRAGLREARNQKAFVELSIRQAVESAFSLLQSAREQIRAEEKAERLAERGYQQANRLYEVGLVNLREVVAAQVDWETSRLERLDAINRYNRAVYQLKYLAGFLDSENGGAARSDFTDTEGAQASDIGARVDGKDAQ